MKKLFLFAISILAIHFQSLSQVVINEYSASNRSIITDNYGSYEDYIELYNTSAATVDLSGWYLADKYTNLQEWQFPAGISISANGFLLIWASQHDIVVGPSIHTNFQLTQTSFEHLALSDAAGNVVDSFSLFITLKDHSCERRTNGGAVWGVTNDPTPGYSNTSNTNYAGYAGRPVMSVVQGFYPGAQSVSITDPDPNAVIHYTLDGSEPTIGSPVYSAPINMAATGIIRARGFSTNPDYIPSFIETNTYFINDTHTFYVVSLSSDDFNSMFNSYGTYDIDAYIEFFDKNQNLVAEGGGKVDPHGNDSWAFPQKGIDFEMEDDYGYAHTIPYPIFHLKNRPSYDHIILKAGASDNYPFSWGNSPGHLRDAFVQTLAQEHQLDIDERSYEPCIVYINGEYWGVYEVREKTDEPDFTNYYYNQKVDDIDVCKFWGGLNVPYGSDTAWNNLYYFITGNSMTVPANYQHVTDRLDVNSMIDYDIFNTYVINCDWISWNTEWWRGRNPNGLRTKWTYSFWDEDNVYNLGQNYSGWPTTNYTADPCDIQTVFSNSGPSMGHMDMLTDLLLNDDFKNAYINRYADLMNTALSCDTVLALLQEFVTFLTPEMPGQIARWGGSMATWQNNIVFIQDQIIGRCAYIDSALIDCYQLTGPFDVTLLVDPPGLGQIKISTLTPTSYPWTGTYFGGVDLDFHAIPAANMQLSYWEVNNNTVLPNTTSPDMFIGLTASDTVIAHFEYMLPQYGLTVDVNPVNSGTVTIEGTTPASYPYVAVYASGNSIDMTGNAATNYQFDYWELQNHFVNPNSTNPNVNFTLATGDYILAHFRAATGIDEVGMLGSLQVFPSLTNDDVHISYQLQSNTDLSIQLHSVSGQLIRDLTKEDGSLMTAGNHDVDLSMAKDNLSPGVYFLQFEYPGFHQTYKVVFLPH